MKEPKITVLMRTSARPKAFKIAHESFVMQRYENKRIIVGSDNNDDYMLGPTCITYDYTEVEKKVKEYEDHTASHAPYNLHMNELARLVEKDSFVMFLDDDDKFSTSLALQTIANQIKDENSLVMWQVRITPSWKVPEAYLLNQEPEPGHVSGIGVCFHIKHWIDWEEWTYGDYRVIKHLWTKLKPQKVIYQVLTECQSGPGSGKRVDLV